METRDRAAGNRHEKHREEVQALYFKADKSGHVQFGVLHKHTDHAAQNHADQQEHAQVVAGLLQKPHRHDGCAEEVGEDHIAPGHRVSVNRIGNADPEHENHEHNAHDELFTARGFSVFQIQAESHGDKHVENRNRGSGRVGHNFCALSRKAIEGVGHNVAESRDHQEGEKPAEEQKELTAGATDVLLNHHAH